MRVDVRIAGHARARRELGVAVGIERSLVADLARQLEAQAKFGDVGRRREIVAAESAPARADRRSANAPFHGFPGAR